MKRVEIHPAPALTRREALTALVAAMATVPAVATKQRPPFVVSF
jgi:hypothetical protein